MLISFASCANNSGEDEADTLTVSDIERRFKAEGLRYDVKDEGLDDLTEDFEWNYDERIEFDCLISAQDKGWLVAVYDCKNEEYAKKLEILFEDLMVDNKKMIVYRENDIVLISTDEEHLDIALAR